MHFAYRAFSQNRALVRANSRLPPCNAISEGRPTFSNTSSEAGALPLEVRIENDLDRKFSKSKFFHIILENTFLHVHCELKIFFRCFEVCTYVLPLDTQFWTRGLPLVMRSQKAGLPLATRARKWEPSRTSPAVQS